MSVAVKVYPNAEIKAQCCLVLNGVEDDDSGLPESLDFSKILEWVEVKAEYPDDSIFSISSFMYLKEGADFKAICDGLNEIMGTSIAGPGHDWSVRNHSILVGHGML